MRTDKKTRWMNLALKMVLDTNTIFWTSCPFLRAPICSLYKTSYAMKNNYYGLNRDLYNQTNSLSIFLILSCLFLISKGMICTKIHVFVYFRKYQNLTDGNADRITKCWSNTFRVRIASHSSTSFVCLSSSVPKRKNKQVSTIFF